jgi:hypothetical protein
MTPMSYPISAAARRPGWRAVRESTELLVPTLIQDGKIRADRELREATAFDGPVPELLLGAPRQAAG